MRSFQRKKSGTTITIFRNRNQELLGFHCVGHAGYDVYGKDVVCAGISALVLTTIEAIGRLTEDSYHCNMDEKTGDIQLKFKLPAAHDATLLIQAMILGLEGIQTSYGKEYLRLRFEEV